MNIQYSSHFAPHIEGLIEQKRMMGYPYNSSAWVLKHFDIHCRTLYSDEKALNREIVMSWCALKDGEHQNGLMRRVTPVRQLAKYMNSIGLEAYIAPNDIPSKQIRYIPHIFTKKELSAFFKSADNPPPIAGKVRNSTRDLVLPVIFRVMYCCGLRKGETLNLQVSDVDLEKGSLLIKDSKEYKSRIVYMSDDVSALCRRFDQKVREIFPTRQAFFPNINGLRISSCVLGLWFHLIWDDLPESKTSIGSPARIHDFRHTFAVNRLNRWIIEGKNIDACVQYLGQYMGHTLFESTDYYLHLVKEFMPEVKNKLAAISNKIIPEAEYEDWQ